MLVECFGSDLNMEPSIKEVGNYEGKFKKTADMGKGGGKQSENVLTYFIEDSLCNVWNKDFV